MVKGIENNIHKIIDLCKTHQVDAFYLFGSATTDHFNKNSDYDFLVKFNKSIELLNYADNYFTLLDKLKRILKRDVDLISERSLKNAILIKEINNTKVPLYES
jgi:predicted nucleotidyltransferase